MIIDCISDLHGFYPKLEEGDLLIVAGDLTARDTHCEHFNFSEWLDVQPYRKKIVIAGNHDNNIDADLIESHRNCTHLCDSVTEFEGLKIWGSPWTKKFPGMNPHCMAFTVNNDDELAEKWAFFPDDLEILITHSPPFTIRDMTISGEQVGSASLMAEHVSRIKPKLWVFGHIHEAYGIEGPYQWNNTKYVNASHVNENYKPVNKPIRVIL